MPDNETRWGPRVAAVVVVVGVVIGIVIAIATGNFPRTAAGEAGEAGEGEKEAGEGEKESETGEGEKESEDGPRAFNLFYLLLIPVVAAVAGGVAWLARRRPSLPPPARPTITIFNGVKVESSPNASMLTRARQVVGRGLGYTGGVTGLHTMFDPLTWTVLPVHEIFWNDSSKVMEAVANAGNRPMTPHDVRLLIEGDTPPSRDILIGTRKARRARRTYTAHRDKTQAFVNNLNALSLALTQDTRAAAFESVLKAAEEWDASRKSFEEKTKVRAPIFNGPRGGGAQVLAIRSALEMSLINEMNASGKTTAEKKALAEELRETRGVETLNLLAKSISPMPDIAGAAVLLKAVTAAAKRGAPPDAVPSPTLLDELKKAMATRKLAMERLVARKRKSTENLGAVASFLKPLMEDNPVLPSTFTVLAERLKKLQEQEELTVAARAKKRLSLKRMVEDGAKAWETAREFRRVIGASTPTTREFRAKMTRLAGYKEDRERRLRDLLRLVEDEERAATTAREIMASPLTQRERREAQKRLDKLIKRMEAAGGGPYLVEAREWRDKLANLVPRDIVQVEALGLQATSAMSAKLINQLKTNMGMQESQLAVDDLDSAGRAAAPLARQLKEVTAARIRAQTNLAITNTPNARAVLEAAIKSEEEVRVTVRGAILSPAHVARVFLVAELAGELEQELTRKEVADAKLIALEDNRVAFEEAEAGATAFLEAKTQEIMRLLAPPRPTRRPPSLPPRDPPNIRKLKKKLEEARQALAEANSPVPMASLEADVAAAEAELNMASNLPTFAETLRQVTELAKADQEYARTELELVLAAPPDQEALDALTAATLAKPDQAKELEAQRKKLLLERYGPSPSPLDAINASRALLNAPPPPPQPTTGKATAFDWPAIAQQNADLAHNMAMGIHNLRVRQRFLSLALQGFPKGSPLAETYIAQMKANRELMEGSRQIYNQFFAKGTSAFPDPFPQVKASTYSSWGEPFPAPLPREPSMEEDVYFATLPANTLVTFTTEINKLLQEGVDYDTEGLRAVLSATRGITFDDEQMGASAVEVLRRKVEVIEAYNDRRTYLAELYMLREQADDREERDDAIARMRRHIEGFEKDLGLEKVSLVDELQTLEHTAQSARVYLANAKLPSLFPANWEPTNDPALDKAGRELKKLYETGRATNDTVTQQRGVVY